MKMLLSLTIFLLVLNFTGCKNDKNTADNTKTQPSSNSQINTNSGKLLFTINGRPVYEKDTRTNDINASINDELLYESAINKGIDKEESVQRTLKIHKMNLLLGLLKRKIIQDYLANNEITEDQVTEHYNNNISKYTLLDLTITTASDIETAKSIQNELKNASSPESIALKYKKLDPKVNFKRLRNTKSFIDNFSKLEPGEISDPIDQGSEFKVVRIDKVNTAPLNRINKSIRYELTNNLKFVAVQKYIEQLRNEIEIQMPETK